MNEVTRTHQQRQPEVAAVDVACGCHAMLLLAFLRAAKMGKLGNLGKLEKLRAAVGVRGGNYTRASGAK